MSHHPPAVLLAEPDGQPQAVGGVPLELVAGTAVKERPGEGDVVGAVTSSDTISNDAPDRCHSKKGGQASP